MNMNMANVVFNFNEQKITIQCEVEEKIKDICNRFASKVAIDINSLYFLYDKNLLNLDLTFKDQVNSNDKKSNRMNVLVYDSKNCITEANLKNKVNEIKCPTCCENCRIFIKDYKIRLYGCKNNHEINKILLEEFNFIQNINENKIRFNICILNI